MSLVMMKLYPMVGGPFEFSDDEVVSHGGLTI